MLRSSLILALLCTAFPASAWAAEVERLVLLRDGNIAGTLVATTDGENVSVDYKIDDNGRGAKFREDIQLGEGGMPSSWSITGTSELGTPVNEMFAYRDGHAVWKSQADSGSVATTGPALYLANDTTPWAMAIYSQVIRKAPGMQVSLVPDGTMRLVKMRDLVLGEGAKATPVTAYRLEGGQIEPDYFLLDRDGRLFAKFGRYIAVREGYEGVEGTLRTIGRELELERITAISAEVTHRFDRPVRIRNVHLIDPVAGTRGPASTIVIERDRIAAILPASDRAAAKGDILIDGAGGSVYPGLHDMHVHATLRSGLFHLAAGVTTVRDMGNENAFIQDLLPRLASGEVAGPRLVASGKIEGRSPYSSQSGIIFDTVEEGRAAIRWYAEHGYPEIKFYNSVRPEMVAALTAEAHRLGLRTVGHIPAFATTEQAIEDGFDGVAHINQVMLSLILKPGEDPRTAFRITVMERVADLDLKSRKVADLIAVMKAHGTMVDPTLVTFEQFMRSRAGRGFPAQQAYMSHMPFGYQRFLKRDFIPIKDAAADARYELAFTKTLEFAAMLKDAGILLVPGTDDGNGFFAQREVELFTQIGFTPAGALKAATVDSAAYLEQADVGTIAVGQKADVVLAAGNPLEDIAAIKRPRMVVRDGVIFFPAEIYRAMAIEPFATPPTVSTAP
jgi:hypothetical protein